MFPAMLSSSRLGSLCTQFLHYFFYFNTEKAGLRRRAFSPTLKSEFSESVFVFIVLIAVLCYCIEKKKQ